MKLSIVLALITNSAAVALVDHDNWEFHGGMKKRRAHGLNLATKHSAPKSSNGGVDFDEIAETQSEIIVTNDEAPEAPKVISSYAGTKPHKRADSRSKTKEELLLLPDRYSVLNFDAGEYSEDECDDNESTNKVNSWWGRLYVEGCPAPMQYFRAHFGEAPPHGNVKLLLASPPSMCDNLAGLSILNNAHGVDGNTVVVAVRGECTFGEKAIAAFEAGAAGIVFVNNMDGNFHLSGPEAHDAQISASMISKDDGICLLNGLTHSNYAIPGRFVPMTCRNGVSSSYCMPANVVDEEFVSKLEHRGKMSLEGIELDYVQGEFGSWMNPLVNWTIIVPSVIGGDAHCCDKAGFEGNDIPNNHAIVCLRGECDFVTKAENAASTGAGMMINSSYNNTLFRMGADPPHRGRKVKIAATMVGFDHYERIVDSFFSNDSGLHTVIETIQHIQFPPLFSGLISDSD